MITLLKKWQDMLFSRYFSDQGLNTRQILVVLIALLFLVLSTYSVTLFVENLYRSALQSTLVTLLQNTTESVRVWAKEQQLTVESIAKKDHIKKVAKGLLALPRDRDSLRSSLFQWQLRYELQSYLESGYYEGYFIIAPDNISLGSNSDSNVGSPNLLVKFPELLAMLRNGETRLTPIQQSDVPLLREAPYKDLGNETMFVATPIRDDDGSIIAVLTLRINPYKTVLPLASRAKIGETGESLVFDENGLLLSKSRYEEDLVRSGLLATGQSSASHIKLLDPGRVLTIAEDKVNVSKQWPLTRMATSATRGESGIDLDGYRDYRGVPVVGVWHWDNDLKFGFAIEQDVSEAYQLFYIVRLTIIAGGIIATIILMVLVEVFVLGKRKIDRVQKRLQSIVETASDGIIVINQWGKIESVNPAIENMFGYSAESLINQNLSKLIAKPTRSEHNNYLADFREDGADKLLGKARENKARHSNGDIFPIELTVNRIELDTGLHFAGVISDISERKQAEQELEQERDFTRDVLDSLSAHIAVLDETGSIVLSNLAWNEFAKRNQRPESLVGDGINFPNMTQHLPLLCSDESLDAVQKLLEMLHGGLNTFNMRYPCNTVEGQQWLEMRANRFAHRDQHDIVLSHTDITQQVEFEQQLKKANKQMKITALVAENTDNAVIVIDLEGVTQWVNRGFTHLSGYQFEEIIGHKTSEILSGPDTDIVITNKISAALLSGDRIDGEILNYHKNGTPYWVHFEISPVHDENLELRQFVILQSDITEEKRLIADLQREKEASEQANKILRLTQQALDLTGISEFWLRSKDGQVLRVNEQACQHLGYSKEELLKLTVADFDPSIDPESYDELVSVIKKLGWGRIETIHQNKEGKLIPVEISIVYLSGSTLEEPISVCFVIDITDRKKAEQALIKAKEEAIQANRAKSTFLATMSHEIRTPLYGVVGTVDMLAHTKLDITQKDMISTATDSAQLLQSIIDDILDFSKIEAGRLELEQIPLTLGPLVEKLGDNLRHLAEQRAVELLIYCDPEIPEVIGDPVRLRQILFNLAGNAIKFSSGQADQIGQVSIHILQEKTVENRVSLCLRVTDNGIGMSEEVQKRLFLPFVQGEEETTRRFGGTGLGLVITQRLVKMMNGYIKVDSVEGKGSTFEVHISAEYFAEPSKAEDSDLSGLKVILVNGNDDLCWIVTKYLEHAGAELISVHADEAIDSCQNAFNDLNESITRVVIIAGHDPSTVNVIQQKIREALRNIELRFVLLARGQRRHARQLESDGITLDFNGLHRIQLLNGVAAVAGRESPIIETEALPEILQDAPLTADEAYRDNKLVLLADDNATNRKLIVHQLQMLGYLAETAEDGSEALEMWRNRKYTLVMTDCHMPVMDGYQFSQTLRSEETRGVRIPIVAITADAMRGTAQKCFASGMDDYLTKPIQLERLKQALNKWIPHTANQDQASPENIMVAQEASSDAVNPATLGDLLGTQDSEMLAEYYQEFLQTSEPTIEQIRTAFTNNDLAELSSQAHKLKSSARAVGAETLADCCQALELAGKEANSRAVNQQKMRFFTLFDQVKIWINQYIGN